MRVEDAPNTPSDAKTAPTGTTWPTGGPWKVLVVDDSSVNRQIVRLYLEEAPIVLEEAQNGREALERFVAGAYDCVIMDNIMPVMDGLEATRRIRAYEVVHGLPPTPIVGISGKAQTADETACLDAGYTLYLRKPVRKAMLLAALTGLFAQGASS
ncbi:response regulator receiver protein [Solidesulfovibrio fructosivorans JJ]]|uniref:Response regulator receiver protein n=1 Tax=Solidesulfovibrio fructosivorans JJ] TaxID=596151 RepID=E1JU57_SOLFR|nr:response regulator [Solidesulfovibrio fructosivorans]EFL51987.1 response regulator receiver protein [Solidesulfovibrio fructosivorans JJ]]